MAVQFLSQNTSRCSSSFWDRYGGVTSVQRQFPLQGAWQAGARVYHDRVVTFSVMDFRSHTQLEASAIWRDSRRAVEEEV